jgi:very-short-patch-repair endonuclease
VPHAKVSEEQRGRAKQLRRELTDAERKLWHAIKAHRFLGIPFRRQSPLGRYILDFVSHERKIVLEIDGGQHLHGQQLERDIDRDTWLRSQGYQVFRYSNLDVLKNFNGVLESLAASLCAGTTLPDPPPQGGRGKKVRSSRR